MNASAQHFTICEEAKSLLRIYDHPEVDDDSVDAEVLYNLREEFPWVPENELVMALADARAELISE
jgi:hypothetical protein